MNPPTLSAPTGYTHVVDVVARDARTVYVAGQVAFNERREVVGVGDMAAQTEQVYGNLEAALAAAGAAAADRGRARSGLPDRVRV
jgi:enamine deaminase RidA (YjgF/YER057c/UK114 family)